MENSRRVFTNLNRYAKPTTKSENITMDEDDGFAIVTRRLVREHPVLQDKIWYKTRNLPPSGQDDEGRIIATECFTTLETVYNCNRGILESQYKFTKDWDRTRPEPDLLDRLTDDCTHFWDSLRQIDPIELVTSGQRKCSEVQAAGATTAGRGAPAVPNPSGKKPLQKQ